MSSQAGGLFFQYSSHEELMLNYFSELNGDVIVLRPPFTSLGLKGFMSHVSFKGYKTWSQAYLQTLNT